MYVYILRYNKNIIFTMNFLIKDCTRLSVIYKLFCFMFWWIFHNMVEIFVFVSFSEFTLYKHYNYNQRSSLIRWQLNRKKRDKEFRTRSRTFPFFSHMEPSEHVPLRASYTDLYIVLTEELRNEKSQTVQDLNGT